MKSSEHVVKISVRALCGGIREITAVLDELLVKRLCNDKIIILYSKGS